MTRTLKYKDLRAILEKENKEYEEAILNLENMTIVEKRKFRKKYKNYFDAFCDGKRAK